MSILDEGGKDNKPEMSSEERTMRFVAKIIAGTLLLIVAAMTSCTMHSNTYDAERLVEEVKIQQAENERTKMIEETKQKKTEAIEKLIREGNNPIAVKCAITSSKPKDLDDKCYTLGIVLGGKGTDQK